MSRATLTTAFLIATLCLTAPLPAVAQGRTFGDTAQVVVVEVPVTVTRDGGPVRGLTKDDFELYDGRERQELIGFEVIDLATISGPAAATAPVTAAGRRHFLLLFDLAFSDPVAVVKAREAAQQLVRDSLHPTDLVAVATYSLSRGPRPILGFTSDRRQIEQAIATLGAPQLLERGGDPLGVIVADLSSFEARSAAPGASQDDGPGGGRGPSEAVLLDHLREQEAQVSRSDKDFKRNQIVASTRALSDFGRMLDAVDGRKHVVYLSQGFDDSVLFAENNTAADNLAVERGEVWTRNSDDMFGNTRTQNDLEEMIEEFRRANAVLHTIDIGGLLAGGDVRGQRSGKGALVAMADGTGGEFLENYNELGSAMGEVLERTSVTYLLAFQPEDLEFDGEFHRLRVELKDAPRGTDLSYRPGYYAPRPSSDDRPSKGFEQTMGLAELLLGGQEGGSLAMSVLAPPFQVPGEPAYVPVLIELDGSSLLADAGREGNADAHIYAYAMDSSGSFVDYFFQPLSLDLAQVGGALEQGGLKFYGHLDLAPGDYSVRVLVRNPVTGSYALQVEEVSVPATADGLLPPLFPEEPGKWVMVREGQTQQQERTVPYPFMAGEQPYIPAAKPRLGKRDETQVMVHGYGLGEGQLSVSSRVLDAAGQPVEGGSFKVTAATASGGGQQLAAEFEPKDLEAGEYRLEVTVSNPDSGASHTSSAPFVVAGRGG